MSTEPTQTLGQRIDAVLEPLYTEAEQHRATITEVTEQQQALQQKINAATQGLGQIESRMAEVVRAMAGQEPVIAAVVGDASPASVSETTPELVESAASSPAVEPEAVNTEPETEPEPVVHDTTPEPEAASEPEPAAEPVAEVTAAEPALDEEETPPIELDPAADAEAVDEAAALLGAAPAEPEPAPKVDLAAAAERAAAAAKLLREKAAAK